MKYLRSRDATRGPEATETGGTTTFVGHGGRRWNSYVSETLLSDIVVLHFHRLHRNSKHWNKKEIMLTHSRV